MIWSRPIGTADVPALADLNRRFEIHWFGQPEQSEDEIREWLGRVAAPDTDTLAIFADDRMVGAGARLHPDTVLIADPNSDVDAVHEPLLDWFSAESIACVEALAVDQPLRQALTARGWQHTKSSFELMRAVDESLTLPDPHWPDGIAVRTFAPDQASRVHELIYVDAAWTEVPGHPYRAFADWQRIFLPESTVPEQQVLAWRGDRLVGVALGRQWDDRTGWVSQLATAKDERGKGLGRALLAAALCIQRDAGATALGLAVQAANRGALNMYLDAGLQIDREWMSFQPPA